MSTKQMVGVIKKADFLTSILPSLLPSLSNRVNDVVALLKEKRFYNEERSLWKDFAEHPDQEPDKEAIVYAPVAVIANAVVDVAREIDPNLRRTFTVKILGSAVMTNPHTSSRVHNFCPDDCLEIAEEALSKIATKLPIPELVKCRYGGSLPCLLI
ncbi:hypothetical protein C8R42DRAFT_637921 [Lentinula raphanica]|nr:hypothetical protein C8R42DRAFT_637921 [Lentinula raphanica]